MGINVTHTMNGYQFENREYQRNTARQILSKQENSEEAVESIMDKAIFDYSDGMVYSNAQLSILKASSHINVNDSLKETLKYLKSHTVIFNTLICITWQTAELS